MRVYTCFRKEVISSGIDEDAIKFPINQSKLMTIYAIYLFSNPHKGYGRGRTVDYFVSDEDFMYPDGHDFSGQLNAAAVAKAAGYDTYDHSAERVEAEDLEEKADDLREKLNLIEETLEAAS